MSDSRSHRDERWIVTPALSLSSGVRVLSVVQAVDVPSHVDVLTSEQAVANVTRNPCKLYPLLPQPSSLSTISRGPGECLCSPGTCLCTQRVVFRFAYCPPVSTGRPPASSDFGRGRPARVGFQRVPKTSLRSNPRRYAAGAVPAISCDQGSACGRCESLPCPGIDSHLLYSHISRRATKSGNLDCTTSSRSLRRGHR